MFGSHLSISGGMVNALLEAEQLGMDTVQVFTKNQQQWKAPPLSESASADWLRELKRLGWQSRTVSHASYLINLASHDDELFAKSVDLMTDEIERCEALSIPFLVHHPGSFVGWTREQGIARIASAYRELSKRTKGYRTIACLEGVSGAGSQIGGPFEDLATLRAAIIEATGEPKRIGFCLDSCHLHAAGHDMSTLAAGQATLKRFDELCSITNIKVWHINDSKGALASKLDRHDHIGLGHVGGNPIKHVKPGKAAEAKFSNARLTDSGFAAIVRHKAFANVPKILETPKEETKAAKDLPVSKRADSVNLKRLRGLMA
jgi:deoxyribonuclease-4